MRLEQIQTAAISTTARFLVIFMLLRKYSFQFFMLIESLVADWYQGFIHQNFFNLVHRLQHTKTLTKSVYNSRI